MRSSRRLDYPAERLEVIVARGRQPSAQRNKAIEAAAGEWIYFLDDDSEPEPQNLIRASIGLEHPDDLIEDLAQALTPRS